MTIVNPARLESSVRDAVCEQCHLIGRRRVVRAMRKSEDFRPGLPFYRFWSAFVQSAEFADNRFIGQVEQMHASRCFRDSNGSLGCISCHDPHRLPAQTEKVGYYRHRCLECHADRGCGLPESVRLKRNPENDCAGCHMTRLSSSDLPHVAMTDHRILRQASQDAPEPGQPENPRSGKESLVNFHDLLMDEQERILAKRDLGIALCRDEAAGAAIALPLLEKALTAQPDDVPAWESKGFALGQLQRPAEGLAAFQVALSKEPTRESSLMGAAYLATQGGDRKSAIDFWRRAVAISPWRSDYLVELAPLYFQNRDWSAAAESCRAVLRLDPTHLETRKLLVRCELRLGHIDAARAELEALLEFDPPDGDELRQWFAPAFRPAGASGP
jgi:Flp pilus assembly protein TadD